MMFKGADSMVKAINIAFRRINAHAQIMKTWKIFTPIKIN